MTRALPAWTAGMLPVDMDGAATLLGVSVADLGKVLKKHAHYEPRGRKKVFYQEHIRKLAYIISPPIATTAVEVIRNHIVSKLPPDGVVEFEAFISQEFTGKVYLIRCHERVKIGFTTHWERRFRVLRTACPYPVKVLAVFAGNRTFEQFLHVGFAPYRANGEWFEERGDLADLTAAIEALEK